VVHLLEVPDQDGFLGELSRIERAISAGAPLVPHKYIEKGQWCRVIAGPLLGLEGIVVQNRGNTRLVLQIDILGQAASVEIDIDKAGMAQRFYGGTIEAVNTLPLWIPIPGSKAEGRAPGEFRGQLYPIISALTQKGVALDRETGEPLFALVKSVTQSADPSVLPTEQEYADAALDALDLLVDRVRDQTPEIS